MSFDVEQIKDHIEKRFLEAVVETDPFPHVIIEDILPQAFYEELLANWPSNAMQTIAEGWRKSLGVGLLKHWDKEDLYVQDLWKAFATTIVDKCIKRKLGELFHPYSIYKFGKEIDGNFLCNSLDVAEHRLFEDYLGGIGPHIDQGYVFAPVIIYFPDYNDDHHVELGTCLYKHVNNRESVDTCFDDDVTLIKVAPYKANTLVAFMQTPKSWHSATHVRIPENYVRRLYLTNIYLSETFMLAHYGTTFDCCIDSDYSELY